MIWSSASRLKFTVMISTIGRMPPAPRADARADEADLGKWRVAHALGSELREQSAAHRKAPAIVPHVFAHEKDPLIALQRIAQAFARGVSVGEFAFAHGVVG